MCKRKIAAILLAVTAVVGCLTGCGSEASKKYFTIADELQGYSGIYAYGDVKLSVDVDAAIAEMDKYKSADDVSHITVKDSVKAYLKDGISAKYSIKSNAPSGTDADISADITIGDNKYPLELRIRKDGTYISVDTLDSYYKIDRKLGGDIYEDFIDERSFDLAKDTIKCEGYDWVKISGAQTGDEIAEQSGALKINYLEIPRIFKNVKASDIIKLNKDSVIIECNGSQILDLVEKLATDTRDNPADKVELIKSLLGYDEMCGHSEGGEDCVIDMLSPEQYTADAAQTIIDDIKAFKSGKDMMTGTPLRNAIENSTYKAELTAANGTIRTVSRLDIAVEKGKSIISIVGDQSVSELKGVFDGERVAKYADESTVTNKTLLCNAQFKQVERCDIIWTRGLQNHSRINLYTDGKSNVYGFESEMKNIDDRIYLPLRMICERCGLKVDWEDGKALVTDRSGNRVDMSSIIIDDRTYVKVRDFEKLGITVDYSESELDNMATLTF